MFYLQTVTERQEPAAVSWHTHTQIREQLELFMGPNFGSETWSEGDLQTDQTIIRPDPNMQGGQKIYSSHALLWITGSVCKTGGFSLWFSFFLHTKSPFTQRLNESAVAACKDRRKIPFRAGEDSKKRGAMAQFLTVVINKTLTRQKCFTPADLGWCLFPPQTNCSRVCLGPDWDHVGAAAVFTNRSRVQLNRTKKGRKMTPVFK